MKLTRASLQSMKKINCSLILHMLLKEKSLSRAEIAQLTKLSATTVSSLVDEMIQAGIIEESGEKNTTGVGRKGINLEISGTKGFLISISLGNKGFKAAIINFRNEIIKQIDDVLCTGNENVSKFVLEAVETLLNSDLLSNKSMIKGISISTSGIIDDQHTTIIKSLLLKINDLNLKELIQQKYNYEVLVVNDAKSAAFLEYFIGNREINSLLYVSFDIGVGVGLILDGKIYEGYKGLAGEISHITLNTLNLKAANPIEYGSIGKIGFALTEMSVIKRARLKWVEYNDGSSEDYPQTIESIFTAFDNNVKWAVDVLDEISEMIVLTLATLINILSTEKIVLNGWVTESDSFMKLVSKKLIDHPFVLPFEESRLIAARFGQENGILGASTLMLYKVFEDYI